MRCATGTPAIGAHINAHTNAHIIFPRTSRYIRNGAHTILPAAHIILPGRAHHFAGCASHFALRRTPFRLLSFAGSIAPGSLVSGEGWLVAGKQGGASRMATVACLVQA